MTRSLWYILLGFGIVWFALLCTSRSPVSAAEIEINKSVDGGNATVPSGQKFTYVLQYRCASLTEDCHHVVITDVLPPELSHSSGDVQILTSPHVQSANYNASTGTATWTLVDPLEAGTTGEVRLVVKFPPGTTPDNTQTTNKATITADNAATQESPSVTITADAQNLMYAKKSLVNGSDAVISHGADDITTYKIQLCNPSNGSSGGLNMSNIVFTDTLPSGAIFVDATGEGTEISPGVIRWVISQSQFTVGNGTCLTRYVSVRFPNPPFTTSTPDVSNQLQITGTSDGGQNQTLTTTLTHGFGEPVAGQEFSKAANHGYVLPGDQIRYGFIIRNTGTTTLSNYTIVDPIPNTLNVTTIWLGKGNYNTTVHVSYQTNLNASWQGVPSSPFALSSGSRQSIAVSSLNLVSGEYITQLRWVYDTLPVSYKADNSDIDNRTGFTADVLTTDRNGNPVDLGSEITNTATVDYEYNGSSGTSASGSTTVSISNGPSPEIAKDIVGDTTVQPGDQLTMKLTLTNNGSSSTTLLNPTIADLLPTGLDYVANSWTMTDSDGTAPNPTISVQENYNGTGRTLVSWSWGASNPLSLSGGTRTIVIEFTVLVHAGTPEGTLTNTGVLSKYDNSGINSDTCESTIQDTYDLDGDGNTTETICASTSVNVNVAPLALLSSEKLVKGELDTDWSKYPNTGRTKPGGIIDYRLRITNQGNIPMDQIIIADILPIQGDSGIIDTSPRESAWRPYFSKISSVPTETTLAYSMSDNPCLPELDIVSANCEAPNWTSSTSDLASIKSIRFNLNALVLNPGETVELKIRLKAPSSDLPDYGSITWNSFAYIANWADGSGNIVLASEPIKVGVSLEDTLANTGQSLVIPAALVSVLCLGGVLSYRRFNIHWLG